MTPPDVGDQLRQVGLRVTAPRRCVLQWLVDHHLVCRSCGTTVEVTDPPVERWASRIAAEHGFADVQHQVEVFGTCANCVAGR